MENFSKLTKKQLIERLEKQNKPASEGKISFSEQEDELAKIDAAASVANPHQIPFRTTSDHKNIMLYTALNKRVGPLHPDNARRTMMRWKRAGFQLYTSPRTPEQIEAFKQTEEYKKAHEKHLALRKHRRQQSSKGRQEKMIEEITKQTAAAVAGARNG